MGGYDTSTEGVSLIFFASGRLQKEYRYSELREEVMMW